ncbi:MAG: hypothetical protein ACOC1O_00430 [bacterium]
MAMVIVNDGEDEMLNRIFVNGSDLTLRLFTNDYTPVETTILTDLTEVTGDGSYSANVLTNSSWTVTSGQASYAEQTFTFAAGATVYGFFVTWNDGVDDHLLLAERFSDGPYVLPSDGGTIAITPQIVLD